MKYFITFALCAVATIVLVHVISTLLGVKEEAGSVGTWVPVAFLYICFYGLGKPFTKPQNKD
jgi:hypothetical protein